MKVDEKNIYPTPIYPTITVQVIPSYIPATTAPTAVIETPTTVPVLGIKLINFPRELKLADTATFTWEISGPASNVTMTAIVTSKSSQNVSGDTPLDKTGYRVLTTEYQSGNFATPLVFIGNVYMPEFGTWYIRAYARVSGKSIWSPEYTVTVK